MSGQTSNYCTPGSPVAVAEPHDLSPRAKWLRDYYFKGNDRDWNNAYTSFTTGAPWDHVFSEADYYIVPEVYMFLPPFTASLDLMAQKIPLYDGFWSLSLSERRATMLQEAMVNHMPHEIVSDNDLLAGGRFNTQLSKCLDQKEQKAFDGETKHNRDVVFEFHKQGFGNAGATGGHLIPDYRLVVEKGFKFLYAEAKEAYDRLSPTEQRGLKGGELRAMMISAETPRKVAEKYAEECRRLAGLAATDDRREELEQMASNLDRVPWEPAETFWQGLQAVWLAHALVMAEESYPGPGTSFGRLDQHLGQLFDKDVIQGQTITRDFAKDLISSFIFHCNTAYDAQIKIGNQGITAGFGQLMTLSGCGPSGEDLTNELTYAILETFDEWAPILEPKPNVRLHRNSPDRLLEMLVSMIARSQGAPFILNFDERSIAGMIIEGVPKEDAWNYACVGCLENTMQGNDRSGTVNCNPNLAKSIELTLWNGKNMPGNAASGKVYRGQIGPKTGDPSSFKTWDAFYSAWKAQVAFIIKRTVDVYNLTEATRSKYLPTPYVSILVDGCIDNGRDIRQGPPKYGFVTIEGVGFATAVDSLLAIKHFVYDEKKYTIADIKDALATNFKGKEGAIMQALLKSKAPKYGNDDPAADALARDVMATWAAETWKHVTPTGYRFRPGMLSWNYWAGEDAAFTVATPNGRNAGTFMSNAICPTNGADLKGPTAVANSVGTVLGGKTDQDYVNVLPNGASHTITFNPSILRDPEHREKFVAYLRGYIENGGTALQVNMLDASMLQDAQLHPENYGNLLVRVTGYNAYFTAIGRELQDEIIAREMHCM